MDTPADAARRISPWLWLIASLFALRVIAQPLAYFLEAPFLPAFDRWSSGSIPYGLLLPLQLLLLYALIEVSRAFRSGAVRPRRRLGGWLLLFGALYLGSMTARLILGLTVLAGERWFASPLPTVFHFVLAAFVLTTGAFHYRWGHGIGR